LSFWGQIKSFRVPHLARWLYVAALGSFVPTNTIFLANSGYKANVHFFKIEDWKFVSIPDPDWALVIWCGSNPVLKYNGAFVVSRQRSLAGIPKVKEKKRMQLNMFTF
jgi:hypothetical protein